MIGLENKSTSCSFGLNIEGSREVLRKISLAMILQKTTQHVFGHITQALTERILSAGNAVWISNLKSNPLQLYVKGISPRASEVCYMEL